MKKTFSGILLTVLSISMLALAFNVQPVRAGQLLLGSQLSAQALFTTARRHMTMDSDTGIRFVVMATSGTAQARMFHCPTEQTLQA